MKYWPLVLFLIGGWFLSSESILAREVIPSERVETHVNVREAPHASSASVGRLKPGDHAELVERLPRWYRVRLSDGTEGYVVKAWTVVAPRLGPRAPDELRIHAIAVGAGNCAIVECPGEATRPMLLVAISVLRCSGPKV